jgi:virulence-associated protein VapD
MNWFGIGKISKGEEHLRMAGEIIDRAIHRSEHGTLFTTIWDPGAIPSIEKEFQAAVQSDPTNPEYKYLLATANSPLGHNKETLDEIRRISSEYPDFAEAAGYLASNGDWFTPPLYPPWNQSQKSIPLTIIPADSQGCYLSMVRDGCRRTVSFFTRLPQRSLGSRFNTSLRTAIRFNFMQTPYGPVVGAYVLIDTHPTEPYTSESLLGLEQSHAGWPDQSRSGYWLVRLLAQQKHTFVVLAEPSGGAVYFNRKVELDSKAVKELRDVTDKMSQLDPQISDDQFYSIKNYYNQNFSLDAITF